VADARAGRPGLQRRVKPHPMAPTAASDASDAVGVDVPPPVTPLGAPTALVPPEPATAADTSASAPVETRPHRPRPRPGAQDEPWVPLSTSVRRSVRKRLKALAVHQERPMQLICDEALTRYLDANQG
jgi:hypothetical protein